MSELPIAERTIGTYLDTLASSAPTPGGGSVAGLVGALAAALGQMVISLTDRGSNPHPELGPLDDALRRHRDACLIAAEEDERAYAGYVAATKLPKASTEEKATRRRSMQDALITAAETPLELARTSLDLLDRLRAVIETGSSHVLSDADIAATLAHTSVTTALVNVRVNIPMIKDAERSQSLTQTAHDIETQSAEAVARCRNLLRERRSA